MANKWSHWLVDLTSLQKCRRCILQPQPTKQLIQKTSPCMDNGIRIMHTLINWIKDKIPKRLVLATDMSSVHADSTDYLQSLKLSLQRGPLGRIQCPQRVDDYVFAGQLCIRVQWRMLLICSPLLLEQCPACLVSLTWMFYEMGGKWLYNYCLVWCCFQDLFKTAGNILYFSFSPDVSLESKCCSHTIVLIQQQLGRIFISSEIRFSYSH